MKKILLLVLALCLMLSAASAEVTMTEIRARSVELNTAADTLLVQNEDRTYHVESLSGEALSADFPYAKIRDGMFLVSMKDEYNGSTGVLNGQGQEVVPPEYFNAEIISDRWVAAQTWKPSTAENYDVTVTTLLSDEGKKYYLVDTVDLYYCGEKKGTLTRMEYNDAQAFGDYLRVRNREGEYTFYNKEMEKSPVAADGSSEYADDYKTKTVTHQGSGKAAFAPGCDLTPEEVQADHWVNYDKQVLDLQGNVTADLSAYESAYKVESGLIRVQNADRLYGLVDENGKEISPCKYTEIGYDLTCAKKVGYMYAVRDGKAGFISVADGTETGFEYPAEAVRELAAWLKVEDKLNGVIYAVSAAAGKLEGSWTDMQAPYANPGISSTLAVVADTEGHVGVIDQKGNEIVPLDGTFSNTYDLKVSDDGKAILGNPERGIWYLYLVSDAE